MITSGYDRVAAARDGRESVNNLRKNLVNTPSISIGVHQKVDGVTSKDACAPIKKSIGVHQKVDGGTSNFDRGTSKRERKKGSITQDMFRTMDWRERMMLVEKYANIKDKDFDDGTFAFSVSTFKNLLKELHIENKYIDTRHQEIKDKASTERDDNTIIISRQHREETQRKKFQLSNSTVEMMTSLFKDKKLTNEEKSKVIDKIISDALSARLASELHVEYEEKQEDKIARNKLM